MRAICRNNRGSAIALSERYLGETNETNYSPLMIGKEYAVYALLFIRDRVDFLILAEESAPFWAPSSLFDLIDSQIPDGWSFSFAKSSPGYGALFDAFGINCIIGYSLLIEDYEHYVGLIEGRSEELQRFFEINHRADSIPHHL